LRREAQALSNAAGYLVHYDHQVYRFSARDTTMEPRPFAVCGAARARLESRGIIVEGACRMTITLPLEPQKEARLVALAQAKGVTTDDG